MNKYAGASGVWVVWAYGNEGAEIRSVHSSFSTAAMRANQNHSLGERFIFLPYGVPLKEAVEWWDSFDHGTHVPKTLDDVSESVTDQDSIHPLAGSIVHFYYDSYAKERPICDLPEDRAEWVTYDYTAIGTICTACQNVLKRKIS